MRRRLTWLLIGAAMATMATVVIPAWANTLSEEKAKSKTKAAVLDRHGVSWDLKIRTRAHASNCQRLKDGGTDDPHRIRCQGRLDYYWAVGPRALPNDRTCFVTVRKKHSNGKVVVESMSC